MKSNLNLKIILKGRTLMKICVFLFQIVVFTSLLSCHRDQDSEPLIPTKTEEISDSLNGSDIDENSDTLNACVLDNFEGSYTFSSDTHTSTHKIELFIDNTTFDSKGMNGYGFWFPASPFSGEIKNCEITVKPYENVKRQGLHSPGGTPRYYYESMNGFGEYFPEEDSIKIFLNYKRTGDFPLNFSGNIYMKKID